MAIAPPYLALGRSLMPRAEFVEGSSLVGPIFNPDNFIGQIVPVI
jgi:hypothetical protein